MIASRTPAKLKPKLYFSVHQFAKLTEDNECRKLFLSLLLNVKLKEYSCRCSAIFIVCLGTKKEKIQIFKVVLLCSIDRNQCLCTLTPTQAFDILDSINEPALLLHAIYQNYNFRFRWQDWQVRRQFFRFYFSLVTCLE